MLRFSFLLVSLGLWSMAAQGQFWDRVHRLLNGDSTAGPDHDTAYITSFRNDLVVSAVATYQGSSIRLRRKDDETLTYRTNTPVQYGFALDYKWLGVEATFTIPGLSRLDPDFGATTTTGLGFGLTGRRWWFRNFFRTSTGYSVTDPELVDPDWDDGDPHPYRGDISNFTYMATLNHGFNSRRFSYNAAIYQLERQERSAGSWTAGGTFWYMRTECTDGLVPAYNAELYTAPNRVGQVERWLFSVTAGYAYTWNVWRYGFVNAMAVPGIGTQQQKVVAPEGGDAVSGWDVAGTIELRAGAGYVGDRWYAALTLNRYESTGAVVPDVRLGSSFANVRIAAGWRFKNVRPVWPRVGL